MPSYGYTIIFSTLKNEEVKQLIRRDSPKIQEINNVLRSQFNSPQYDCHLDHLMLFSISFLNMKTRTRYNGMYIISLVEINHRLFITNSALQKLLDSQHEIRGGDIYSAYPSFRFDKFHVGDYFYVDDSDKIIINKTQTNSNGLFRN
jgi:hypothetical protein